MDESYDAARRTSERIDKLLVHLDSPRLKAENELLVASIDHYQKGPKAVEPRMQKIIDSGLLE